MKLSDFPAAGSAGIPPQTLGAVFRRFLRFGLFAWGGPIAQIAMIRRELVEEERWISSDHFNRALAVYQLLPGPEAHELCVYFGMLARGRAGAVAAGLGFMLPGFLLMLLAAWLYFTVGFTSALAVAAFAGIQPAVAALIARGVERIGRHVLTSSLFGGIALAAAAGSLAGIPFGLILAAAGAMALLGRWGAARVLLLLSALTILLVTAPPARDVPVEGLPEKIRPIGEVEILGAGLRAGLLTFGGAYTAIPFIRRDAVVEGGWLREEELLDGVALASVLPAPLIIFGTFVGYAGAGVSGACLMTLGIFTPAFAFTLVGHALLERLIAARRLQLLLAGVTAGAVGIIAATALVIGARTTVHPGALLIFVSALVVLWGLPNRWSTPLVVGLGAAAGVVMHLAGWGLAR